MLDENNDNGLTVAYFPRFLKAVEQGAASTVSASSGEQHRDGGNAATATTPSADARAEVARQRIKELKRFSSGTPPRRRKPELQPELDEMPHRQPTLITARCVVARSAASASAISSCAACASNGAAVKAPGDDEERSTKRLTRCGCGRTVDGLRVCAVCVCVCQQFNWSWNSICFNCHSHQQNHQTAS